MWTWMKRFGRDQEGAVAITYILTIAMVAAALMPGLSMLKDSASQHLTATSEKIRLASAGRDGGRLIVVRAGKSQPYASSVTRR